jgi:hypothetical protein
MQNSEWHPYCLFCLCTWCKGPMAEEEVCVYPSLDPGLCCSKGESKMFYFNVVFRMAATGTVNCLAATFFWRSDVTGNPTHQCYNQSRPMTPTDNHKQWTTACTLVGFRILIFVLYSCGVESWIISIRQTFAYTVSYKYCYSFKNRFFCLKN